MTWFVLLLSFLSYLLASRPPEASTRATEALHRKGYFISFHLNNAAAVVSDVYKSALSNSAVSASSSCFRILTMVHSQLPPPRPIPLRRRFCHLSTPSLLLAAAASSSFSASAYASLSAATALLSADLVRVGTGVEHVHQIKLQIM